MTPAGGGKGRRHPDTEAQIEHHPPLHGLGRIGGEKAEEAERTIDSMRATMRDAHIERLKIGKCGIEGGLAFINLLARLEKIGDYCYSIFRY